MQKRSSKLESTRKFEQNRSCWKILTMVKVNGQLSTNDVCWRGSVTSPGAYVAGCEAQQARGARGWARDLRVRRVADTNGAWQRVFVRQKLPPARGGACDAVSGRSWLGFARDLLFCLSMPFFFAVEWAERWYPRVAGTVGVTAVARFWQWLSDEGEGSGRMTEMSTGARKSEKWLWYHVNNIK